MIIAFLIFKHIFLNHEWVMHKVHINAFYRSKIVSRYYQIIEKWVGTQIHTYLMSLDYFGLTSGCFLFFQGIQFVFLICMLFLIGDSWMHSPKNEKYKIKDLKWTLITLLKWIWEYLVHNLEMSQLMSAWEIVNVTERKNQRTA